MVKCCTPCSPWPKQHIGRSGFGTVAEKVPQRTEEEQRTNRVICVEGDDGDWSGENMCKSINYSPCITWGTPYEHSKLAHEEAAM